MRIILILFSLFFSVASLSAQTPVPIKFSSEQHPGHAGINVPDNVCNAGTFTFGAHTGQSNDVGGAVTYLCKNDIIELIGDGNATFMDPQLGTPAGVNYAFFDCPPTVAGPDLAAIIADPCVANNPAPASGLWLTAGGQANGNHTFSNTGSVQSTFNTGNPIQMWFAPITVDDFANDTYEQTATGQPLGPCTNVNLAEKFSVVYLNEITIDGINPNSGNNDCVGKFRVKGGLPQFNTTSRYTIDVFLQGNPSVKAVMHSPVQAWQHGANIIFSVPTAGTYTILVTDAKGCASAGATINMNACVPTDNVILDIPAVTAVMGSTICVPINVQNFTSISAFSTNLSWNPAILQYNNVSNPHPTLSGFVPANHLNEIGAANGLLNINYFNPSNTNLNITNGGVMLELCFTVIGANGSCSPITAASSPGVVDFTGSIGNQLALTVDAGQVCVGALGALDVTAVPHDTCNADGSITITASGGVAPYDITFLGPNAANSGFGSVGSSGSSFVAGPLTRSGNYKIILVDANGTIDSVTVMLQVKDLGSNITFTQPTCFDGCNGTAKAIVVVNNSILNNPGNNYSFTWNVAGAGNQQNLTGLCSGSIAVTVTDVLEGCTATASLTLTQPQVIDKSIQVIPASCTGVANGTININVSGGTPFTGGDYKFNWAYSTTQNGTKTPLPALTATTNPSVANMLAIGFYHVTITDANMCTETLTTEVDANKVIAFDPATVSDASCFGKKDGELNIQFSTNPITPVNVTTWDYTPKPLGSTAVPGLSSYLVSGLPAGMYSVSAKDADGCMLSQSFTIAQPPGIVLNSQTLINPSCVGINNGSISLNPPSGGAPPFTYAWSNGETTQNINTLVEDDYSVTVTDANGCTNTKTFTLSLPAPPVISSIDSTSVKCGTDGCLKVNAIGSGLTYVWTNLTTGAVQGTTPQICNLAGGQYIYAVTNSDNCASTSTVTLGSIQGLFFADTNYIKPSCFGLDDGIIGIDVSGGTPNYSYNWSPTQPNSSNAFNIGAGTYKVTVTDDNNCKLQGEFTLTNPPEIKIEFTNIQGTSCNNLCDGQVLVTATYDPATPTPGTFTFGWDDLPSLNSETRNDLCGGSAIVTVRDANNCFSTQEVVISSPPPVIADTFYTTPATCDGDSNGTATVSGGGGNGGAYTYDWGFSSDDTVSGLAAGQYIVTIFDNQGCTGTQTFVVLEPDPIVALIDSSATENVDCNGSATGQIGLNIAGGNQGIPPSFLWTNGIDTVGNTGFVDQLAAGTYFVTVTDYKGCTGDAGPFTLSEPPPVAGSYLDWEELLCYGDQTTVNVDTVWGGVGGPYQFSVDFGVALDVDFPVSVGGGTHVISYFDRLGCYTEDSIQIAEPAEIMVNFTPNEVEIELGDSLFQLQPIILGAAVDSFIWTPAVDLSNPFTLRPLAGNFETQTFTLTVFDNKGCSGTGSILVAVDPNRNVYLPNIFRPGNPSGTNDRFSPLIGVGIDNISYMRIYDRWGELMYEKEDYLPDPEDFSEGWDGKYHGKKVTPGVYIYIVEVIFLDGRVLLYRGDITVVN
jgi:hypothetical protein